MSRDLALPWHIIYRVSSSSTACVLPRDSWRTGKKQSSICFHRNMWNYFFRLLSRMLLALYVIWLRGVKRCHQFRMGWRCVVYILFLCFFSRDNNVFSNITNANTPTHIPNGDLTFPWGTFWDKSGSSSMFLCSNHPYKVRVAAGGKSRNSSLLNCEHTLSRWWTPISTSFPFAQACAAPNE